MSIQSLTPPTEISAFTWFSLAVETNLAKSSSPPKMDSSSTEGVVSLDGRKRSTPKTRERKLDAHSRKRIGHVCVLLPADLVQGQKIRVPGRPPSGCDLAVFREVQVKVDINLGRENGRISRIRRTSSYSKERQDDHPERNQVDHGRRTKEGKLRTTPATFIQREGSSVDQRTGHPHMEPDTYASGRVEIRGSSKSTHAGQKSKCGYVTGRTSGEVTAFGNCSWGRLHPWPRRKGERLQVTRKEWAADHLYFTVKLTFWSGFAT